MRHNIGSCQKNATAWLRLPIDFFGQESPPRSSIRLQIPKLRMDLDLRLVYILILQTQIRMDT